MDDRDTNSLSPFPNLMDGLRDYQAFHKWLDRQKGFNSELFTTMICLTEEVGEVAQVVKRIGWRCSTLRKDGVPGRQLRFFEPPGEPEAPEDPAMAQACTEYRREMGEELADCLAYLCKLANATGIDLEQAYLAKMAKNITRTWSPPVPEEESAV